MDDTITTNGHIDLKPLRQNAWADRIAERVGGLQGGKNVDVMKRRAHAIDDLAALLDMTNSERSQYRAMIDELVATAPTDSSARKNAITSARQELKLTKAAKA